MTSIAIAYHSGYGHTAVIAEEIAKGAKEVGAEVNLVKVAEIDEKGWKTLNKADAIVFGAPTYMGSASAEFERFADDTAKAWFGQAWKDKIAAGFTNAGGLSGDKSQTLGRLMTFACQHSMIWVSQGLMYTGNTPEDINRLSSWVGLMAQSDDDSPAVTPPDGDRKTARLFGARIAEVTKKFKG